MKAVFPKNIKRWLLSGLNFSIGPFSISIIQLFIVAGGVALGVVTYSKLAESSKGGAIFFAALILLFFLFIAFFKQSELGIVAFLSKIIKDGFLDVREKFQNNFKKPHPIDLALAKFKGQEQQQIIEYKTTLDLKKIEDLDTSGLL